MRRDMRAGGEVSGRLLGVLFPNAKRLWRGAPTLIYSETLLWDISVTKPPDTILHDPTRSYTIRHDPTRPDTIQATHLNLHDTHTRARTKTKLASWVDNHTKGGGGAADWAERESGATRGAPDDM